MNETSMGLSYRDLVAWQKAMDLAVAAYGLARKLPIEERFGLTSQMQRAAVSVPSNIAEGQARKYRGEFLRFSNNARGSLAEMETQMLLGQRVGYYGEEVLRPVWEQAQEAGKVLNGLIASLEGGAPASPLHTGN